MTRPLTKEEEASLRSGTSAKHLPFKVEARVWATLDAAREAHAKEVEAHKRTQEALSRYGQHSHACRIQQAYSVACVCGLSAALATEAER